MMTHLETGGKSIIIVVLKLSGLFLLIQHSHVGIVAKGSYN